MRTMSPSKQRSLTRAAAVSAATVTLCLTGAGTAFADLGPIPLPSPSPTGGLIGTVTSTVTTTTDQAGKTVDSVTKTLSGQTGGTGTKDGTTTKKHHKKKASNTSSTTGTTPTTTSTTTNATRTVHHRHATVRHNQTYSALPGAGFTAATAYALPGLRNAPGYGTTQAPQVDPPTVAGAPAAAPQGQQPQVLQASSAVPSVNLPSGSDARRMLVVLGVLLVGVGGALHLRLAQQRLAGLLAG